jgi:hypothetical protein
MHGFTSPAARIALTLLLTAPVTGALTAHTPRQQSPAGSSADASLEGTSWQLVKFQGADGKTLTPDDRTKYTIEFAAAQGPPEPQVLLTGRPPRETILGYAYSPAPKAPSTVRFAIKSWHPETLAEIGQSTPLTPLSVVLVPHGRDLTSRSELRDGIPFPTWDIVGEVSTNPSDIRRLDERLTEMDIMAIATFPSEVWQPERDVIVYQMIRNPRGSVIFIAQTASIAAPARR